MLAVGRQVSALALAALCLLPTASCGQHGLSRPASILLDGPIAVPMESIEGRLVISAMVNGRGPFKFILDSGAEVSLLADTFARDAGLPSQGEMQVGSPGSPTPKTARITTVRKLEIAGLAALDFSALAMDISALQRTVPGLVGVVSAQLLDGLLVSYDFPEQQMRFRRGALPPADGLSIFEWPRGQRRPSVVMDLEGKPVAVDIDTGSRGTFAISRKNTGHLTWAEAPIEGNPIKLLDTEYRTTRGKMKGAIRIGQFTVQDPIVISHEGPFNNVGYAVLKDFVLTIDPANRRFALRTP